MYKLINCTLMLLYISDYGSIECFKVSVLFGILYLCGYTAKQEYLWRFLLPKI